MTTSPNIKRLSLPSTFTEIPYIFFYIPNNVPGPYPPIWGERTFTEAPIHSTKGLYICNSNLNTRSLLYSCHLLAYQFIESFLPIHFCTERAKTKILARRSFINNTAHQKISNPDFHRQKIITSNCAAFLESFFLLLEEFTSGLCDFAPHKCTVSRFLSRITQFCYSAVASAQSDTLRGTSWAVSDPSQPAPAHFHSRAHTKKSLLAEESNRRVSPSCGAKRRPHWGREGSPRRVGQIPIALGRRKLHLVLPEKCSHVCGGIRGGAGIGVAVHVSVRLAQPKHCRRGALRPCIPEAVGDTRDADESARPLASRRSQNQLRCSDGVPRRSHT